MSGNGGGDSTPVGDLELALGEMWRNCGGEDEHCEICEVHFETLLSERPMPRQLHFKVYYTMTTGAKLKRYIASPHELKAYYIF